MLHNKLKNKQWKQEKKENQMVIYSKNPGLCLSSTWGRIESERNPPNSHAFSKETGWEPFRISSRPATQEEAKSIRAWGTNTISPVPCSWHPKPTLSREMRGSVPANPEWGIHSGRCERHSAAELMQRENKSMLKLPIDGGNQQCPVY